MGALVYLLMILLLLLLIKYHISRIKLYKFANKLKGPLSLPLLGNSYLLLGNTDDILLKVINLSVKYGAFYRFWMGPQLAVCISDPERAAKVLLSKKMQVKHDMYDVLKPFIGEVLLAGSGDKWKHTRKLAQYIQNPESVQAFLLPFDRHVEKCIRELDRKVGKGTFDIEKIISKCSMDLVAEGNFGVQLNTLEHRSSDTELHETIHELYKASICRMTRPWMQSKFFYSMTAMKKFEDKACKILDVFNTRCVANLRSLIKSYSSDDVKPMIYKFVESYDKDPGCLNENDLKHFIMSFQVAAHDPLSLVTSSAMLTLGMYPQYQEKLAQEIEEYIGLSPCELRYEDVARLPYLDMVFKETCRLFPVAPFILRKTICDFNLGNNEVIPEGCAVVIAIYAMHLNPAEWEKPLQFYPDHFLPEAVRKRHPQSYCPFSAGPRNCIGQPIAVASCKIFLVKLIQRYIVEADGNFEYVYRSLKSDISVRPGHGHLVRLKLRS